jgi:uncharacterized DUF497 family protein
MRITYDPQKRLKTLEERGLDFEDAPEVFAGFHFTMPDLRRDYGEVREISVGVLKGKVVVIVWTKRDDSRRIISMRRADEDERERYYQSLDRSG